MIKRKDLKLSVDELLEKYPVKNLISDLLEIANSKETVVAEPQSKITVTTQEYEQITGLFRIKGSSNRGRKAKAQ